MFFNVDDDGMNKWLNFEGKTFLKEIGIKKNYVVLDFGCGHGTYTIPASLTVGEHGWVYAIDKNQETLNDLLFKAKEKGLQNIKIIKLAPQMQLPLSAQSVDVILLYDVLHLVEHREQLLIELYQILKSQGILSVYPRHHQTEMNMTLKEVKEEIESVGFRYDVELFTILMHDDKYEKGYVLNFKKI